MNELTCASCGAGSPVGQKFCGSCGASLQGACPNCGASNPPDHRFCGTCGTKLDGATGAAPQTTLVPAARPGATSSPIAERRLVSILFADLVGFTPFAEERDSEDVRETLSRYFDLASSVVTRYGGTVEKFIGDAVMAVWGTPTAHEDDAERCVRAALELVDAVKGLGAGIEARVGVLTGETAVTIGATNQGMVAGDLVNTAARLQSVAAPSTVLVGESTYRAAAGAIAFEPAGDQLLKGKASPVPAWRALRVVAERGGRGRADQLEAPFVGRDVELRLLKDLFHGTGAERRLRHASVVGAAGLGKTRLAWELEKYLDGISETVKWHHGRSPAYGQGITFWSLGEMIRGRAGLAETDDEAITRAKVATMLDDAMPAHPDRRWVESAMLELLGASSGFPSAELFGAWRAFFQALSAQGTVMLVFQDVHWADTGTLDFIDHLVEWARDSPIFILTLARPEILEGRPEWGSGRRGFTSMYLEPLSDTSMRELLAGLVPGLPDTTVQEVVRQAEGVPLYAVETVRMMVTAGQVTLEPDGRYAVTGDVSKLAVPETLTALIAARLDALDAADRTLLLDAAVLGQSFTPAGVAAITGRTVEDLQPRLRALVRRELLREVADERSPERGQFSFVQALVREVAYNTLAKRDRQSRHLAAARWFESLGEPELVGALAGHYLAARSLAAPGAEADALAAQARIALKAAGDRAAALGSHKQAVAFWEQALSVTVDDGDAAELHERAGDSATVNASFDAAGEHYITALATQRKLGDRPAMARVIASYGTTLLNAKRFEEANKLLADAAAEFANLTDDPSLLRIRSQQARGLGFVNEIEAALRVADEVLAQAEPRDDLSIIADTLITRGTLLAGSLRWREGLALLDLARKIAEENGFSNSIMRSINNGLSTRLLLDPKGSFEGIADAMAIARRLGQSGWLSTFPGVYGFGALRTGDWDLGVAELERAVAEQADPRARGILVNNLANLRAGRGEPTAELISELEALVALSKTTQFESYLLESRGWVELCDGRFEAAARTWRELVDLDPYGSNTTFMWLGRIALWRGDADSAAQIAEELWRFVPHGGACQLDYDVLRAAVKGLRGDRVGAASDYRAAIEGYRSLRLPLDEALLAIDMAYVLGSTDTLSLEIATRARIVFNQIRAKPFLEFLDIAIDHGGHALTPTKDIGARRAARSATRTPAAG